MKQKNKCPACGVPFADHPGLPETCRHLENARSALRVISTWATFRNGIELTPESVAKLCARTLKEI